MKSESKIFGDFKVANAAVVLLLFILFSAASPVFFNSENLMDVLKANSVLGIVSCGMLLAIISGGIDVSIGAIISASSCVMAVFMINVSSNLFLAFAVAALTGACIGAVNGFLISRLAISPLVVTLGTNSIINGIMIYLTNGAWFTNIPENLMEFGRMRPFGVSIQAFFFVGALVLTWFFARFTLWGRGIYALGGDEVSAQRIGYNPIRIKFLIYVYMGFLAGIAAVVHTSIMRQVDPNAFKGYEMTVISAVVLGGANIVGGYGNISGIVIGVAFLGLINNGLVLSKVSSYWQPIIVGTVMLCAIAADTLQKKRSEQKKTFIDVDYSLKEADE